MRRPSARREGTPAAGASSETVSSSGAVAHRDPRRRARFSFWSPSPYVGGGIGIDGRVAGIRGARAGRCSHPRVHPHARSGHSHAGRRRSDLMRPLHGLQTAPWAVVRCTVCGVGTSWRGSGGPAAGGGARANRPSRKPATAHARSPRSAQRSYRSPGPRPRARSKSSHGASVRRA